MRTTKKLNSRLVTALIAGVILSGNVSRAQQNNFPRVENAQVQTRAVSGTLAAAIAQAEKSAPGAAWLGYAVDALSGERTVCCQNYSNPSDASCGKCELETGRDHRSDATTSSTASGTLQLEAGPQFIVLLRLQDSRVTRIKLASPNCTLDAGGLRLTWLTGVKPSESVSVLAGQVGKNEQNATTSERREESLANQALTAIALHAGSEAEAGLESFTTPTHPAEVRKHAAFWLGEARGKEGVAALQRMAKTEPSTEVREHIAFALSLNKEPAAVDEMIRMAQEDQDGHVRGRAIFWLAQKAGKRAVSAIDGAIQNDPDTEVKKQAVFALSRLPKDEGVSELIQVAESNSNAVIRKQAMFWLGQSEDPRALQFFEKILSR